MDTQPKRWEAYLSKEDFDRIRSDARFGAILRLARVVNSLQFCFNSLVVVSDADTPANQRQRLNSFLFASGVLYEGLKVVRNLTKHFGQRQSFRNGLEKLLDEPVTKKLQGNILKDMRNKSVFHYDEDVAPKTLKILNLESYLFATGVGTHRGGVYYNLADEVVFNFIIGDESKSKEEEEQALREAMKDITDLLTKFVDSADQLIGEVVAEMGWLIREL
ncbi:MAG TPA: hypothetical protein VM934_12540 [Pyrinomonadaceae bacterium]|jgi:hypothetical protein|nr:hypothetical protein [Pyrinomonadaceae bacterium]